MSCMWDFCKCLDLALTKLWWACTLNVVVTITNRYDSQLSRSSANERWLNWRENTFQQTARCTWSIRYSNNVNDLTESLRCSDNLESIIIADIVSAYFFNIFSIVLFCLGYNEKCFKNTLFNKNFWWEWVTL